MSNPKVSSHSASVPPSLKLESLHSSQSALTFRTQFPLRTDRTVPMSRRTMSSGVELVEKKEVEQLNEWNRPGLSSETLARMQIATFGLSGRSGKNDVEKMILFRRSKGATLRSSESNSEAILRHIQEVSYRRMLKKEEEHLGKERSQNARRYEDELHSAVCALQSSLSSLLSQAKSLRQEASRHRSLILEVESSLKSTRSRLLHTDSLSRMSVKSLRPEDIFRIATKKSQQQSFLFSREQDCRDKVLTSKDAIFRLRSEAEALDSEAARVQHELEAVSKVQVEHFSRILKDGKDTRAQGLAWVVKTLWKAGMTVDDEMFPEFLDREAVRIVLFIAQKSLEADELTEYLLSTKPPTAAIDVQKTNDHWNNIQSRLKALTINITASQPKSPKKPVNPHSAAASASSPPSLPCSSSEVLTQYSDVKAIESRVSDLHELIQQVQTAEIRRLTTECFLNSYEKKYKVTLKALLAAIVGVDVLDRYIATVNKEQKTLSEQLSQTKTFYFMPSHA